MANIKLNNNSYPIPDSKLASIKADFVAHLGTIAGSGLKVVIGGVEYGIDSSKVAGAIGALEDTFVELENGGDIAEEELGVDPVTGEILDSWNYIIASINNNTYATKYSVGNYKPLDLGTEGIVNMQIAAIDADVMSDGSGNAHITWIAKNLLATTHAMNSTSTNTDGWAASEMRTYLSEDIWALIPATVQNSIVPVDKTYYDYTTSSTLTCSDKLWIPSWREVGLGVDKENAGAIYDELFNDQHNRIKELNGSTLGWGLRSAYTNSRGFCGVSSNGSGRGFDARGGVGVALSFCM